jgi:hypothetical protein
MMMSSGAPIPLMNGMCDWILVREGAASGPPGTASG